MPQVTPYIDEHFDGQIWKLDIDGNGDLLLLEIRNAANKEVSFAAISLTTGKTNFKNLVQRETWLSGLSGGYNGIVFLHGFEAAQSPNRKGITAIAGISGAPLWSNFIYTISKFSVNGLIAYNTQLQPVKLLLLDAKTGAILRPFNVSIDIELNQKIVLPQILNNLPPEFNAFFDGELQGNVHYMEHNDFRIVSLHSLKHGVLDQLLLITQNGSLVYQDILTDKIQKLQPEAFIMYGNKLICIKNTRELKVFNL